MIALDPGPVRSAYVHFRESAWPKNGPFAPVFDHGILPNAELLDLLTREAGLCTPSVVVEMIASYGMAVGAEVFETCVWIGRFVERATAGGCEVSRLFRRDVKLHLCGQARAKDANIRAALIDKFGPGKDVAIGTKKAPGPLFGIRADEWAALAVAVTWTETEVFKRREARNQQEAA